MSDLLETGAAPEAAIQTEAPAPAPEAPIQEAPSVDAELQAIWDSHHPPRDDGGRFAQNSPAEPEKAAGKEPEGQSPEPVPSEAPQAPIAAPNSWSADMKAKWETLPPDAKEYIARRESDAHAQITRMGQQVKSFEPVSQVLEQNKDVFQGVGMTYEQGISALLQAQRALTANPVAAIHKLASDFGVDLAKLYGSQESGSQPPQVVALQAELAEMRRQLADTSSRVMTREQRELQSQQMALEAQIADFVKDKPDFEAVEDDILALLPGIRAQKPGISAKELLADAYERAQWMNPQTRAKRLEAERKAEADKAAEAAKAKAADAKKAGSLNVRSGQNAKAAAQSLDQELRAIWDRNQT